MTRHAYIDLGLAVLKTEADAISALCDRLDQNFSRACDLILNCSGRIVVTGMGKSGHIGNKIAATLASTGTPSFFMHSGEASHGDLGMITADDLVIALSKPVKSPCCYPYSNASASRCWR
jgi:arabinose-5-phosphate isomerase